MNVIGQKRLQDFWGKHPRAKSPLQNWYQAIESVTWGKFADVRKTYPAVDRFGRCYIFNIGGNNYRLITWIDFHENRVYVRNVLTHAQYSKNKWKKNCS